MDIEQLNRNRNNFPAEELQKYAGRYVAWSPDGTRIIADADDLGALCDAVDASPYDPADCLMEPIFDPDTVVLGGGFDL
jgi:hypothetical protein